MNFFGGARTLQLEGSYSALSKGARVNFRQPYVFSPRNSLFLTGQSWHRNEPAYTLNTNGGQRHARADAPAPRRRSRAGPPSSSLSLTYTDEFQSYQITEEALQRPDVPEDADRARPRSAERHGARACCRRSTSTITAAPPTTR